MSDKEESSRMKDEYSKGIVMLQGHCKLEDGGDIPAGFLGRLKDRDEITLSAIILGFFVQAVPTQRS